MKTLRKTLVALAAVLALGLTLAACDDGDDSISMLQADMDITYLGDFSQKNLDACGYTQAEAEEEYLWNLEQESLIFVDSFIGLVDGEFPNDDLMDQTMEMFKNVYAKSDYTLSDSTKRDDGNYNVTVKVRPLDFVHLVDEGYDQWYEDFFAQYTEEDLASMTEDDLYIAAIQSFLDYANSKVAAIDYLDEKSIVVQFGKTGEEGDTVFYGLKDDDWANLDNMIIDFNPS